MQPVNNAENVSFFSNAWNNTIVPFVDREWIYIKNGWTIVGAVIAVAGIIAGIAVVALLGTPAAPIGGMVAVTIGGLGLWCVVKGRTAEEGKVLKVHLGELFKAVKDLENDIANEEKIKKVDRRMTFIEPYEAKYPKVDNIRDDFSEWCSQPKNKTMFKHILAEIEALQGIVAHRLDHEEEHIELAKREWERYLAGLPLNQ